MTSTRPRALFPLLLAIGLASAGCAQQTPVETVPAAQPVQQAPASPAASTDDPTTPSPTMTPSSSSTPEQQKSASKSAGGKTPNDKTPSAKGSAAGTATPSGGAKRTSAGRKADGSVDCSQTKCVALTFDDGPGKDTPKVLEALTKEKASGTFFMQGPSLKANPDIARQVANTPGMEIANHSATHPQLTAVSASRLTKEVSGNKETLKKITGKDSKVFRPPYGARNANVDAAAKTSGEAVILWDVDTMDWKSRNASAVRAQVKKQVKPGSIVLMHDIHASTVAAVPGIVSDLKADGYTMVTVSELLGSPQAGKVYSSAD